MNGTRIRNAAGIASAVMLLSACVLTPESGTGPPAGGAAPPTVSHPPASPYVATPRGTILAIQRMLRDLGYDIGVPDGVVGDKTAATVRLYQAQYGLAVDGRATSALFENLTSLLGRDAGARRLAGDARPQYEPGDTYVYSDGRSETVVRVEGGLVLWRDQSGGEFERYENFVLPPVSWVTETHLGYRRVNVSRDVLWPLKRGKTEEFVVSTELVARGWPPKRTDSSENWACEVGGIRTITVPAGTFDTYRLVCRISPAGTSDRLTRVWYYAPSIRHYVRRESSETPDRHSDLTGIRFGGQDWPPAARAGLGWAVDDTLENKKSGASTLWRSSGVDATVRILPATGIVQRNGASCRRYLTIVTRLDRKHVYPALACRSLSGRWRIPTRGR